MVGARNRTLFTLIELLVVIAIISVLASMLLPALSAARDKARQSVDQSNMRQIYMAAIMYSGDFEGALPQGQSELNDPQAEYTSAIAPDGDHLTPGNQPTALWILVNDNYITMDLLVNPSMGGGILPAGQIGPLGHYSYRYNESGDERSGHVMAQFHNERAILSRDGVDGAALIWTASDYRRESTYGIPYARTVNSQQMEWPYGDFGFITAIDGTLHKRRNYTPFNIWAGVYAAGSWPATGPQWMNRNPTSWYAGVDFALREVHPGRR